MPSKTVPKHTPPPPLEPTATWACPHCYYRITDERSVVELAIEAHQAAHPRTRRRGPAFCSECSCHVDHRTVGCETCRRRFASRKKRARG
jgi:hypothetical protein